MKPASSEAGFTLVELLITLAILSLMAVYSWGAVAGLFRLNGQVSTQESQAEADAAARYLHDEIAGLRVVFTRDRNNAPRLMFLGNEHELGFVAVANGERETGGLYWVRYRIDEHGNLVSERSLLRDDRPAAAQTVILLRKVREVGFSYWGASAAGSANAQRSSWNRSDQLPRAIEINVTFADGTARRWPALVAAIAAGR